MVGWFAMFGTQGEAGPMMRCASKGEVETKNLDGHPTWIRRVMGVAKGMSRGDRSQEGADTSWAGGEISNLGGVGIRRRKGWESRRGF